VQIDPYAWLLTVPLTVALVGAYRLPGESLAKRCWREIAQAEALAWARLGLGDPLFGSEARSQLVRKAIFRLLLVGLAASSIASFAVFLGA
jgi:hypothetical protein